MNNFVWKVIIAIRSPIKTGDAFEAPFAEKLKNSAG